MRSRKIAPARTNTRSEADGRLIAGIALVAVWIVTGAIIFAFGSARPTPQSIASYLGAPSASRFGNARDREQMLTRVAGDLKDLTAGQRTELWQRTEMRLFFGTLTPEEQAKFFELIWPRVNELMEAFNRLAPSQRRKLVERASRNMQAYEEGHPQPIQDAKVQQIISSGFRSFYSTASADSKMDIAPLIEEMQRLAVGVR